MDWSKVLLHLPLADLDRATGEPNPWLAGMLAHDRPDGFWKRLDITREVEQLNIPAQHVVGYYDFFSRESVGNFKRLRRHGNQQIILGPWDHGTIGKSRVGDVDFGSVAQIDLAGENLSWFDRFLKRTTSPPFSPVRYFSMGDGVWHDAEDWPPPASRPVSFYLHFGGSLSLQAPSTVEPVDRFRADPTDPAPAIPARTSHLRENRGY